MVFAREWMASLAKDLAALGFLAFAFSYPGAAPLETSRLNSFGIAWGGRNK